jgi:hypothetical protein
MAASWTTPVTNRTSLTHDSYGFTDLNRVNENTEYLSDLLNSLRYDNVIYYSKYDWTRTDFFTLLYEVALLVNINSLTSILTLPSGTPELPASLDNLEISDANDIEEIQEAIYDSVIGLQYQSNLNRPDTYSSVGGDSLGLI